MRKKKVHLIIEASSTGFGIYGENFPVTAYGNTIEEAKKELESVITTMIDYYKKEGIPVPKVYNNGQLSFVFQYDIASIFKHFGVLDISAMAKRINMNPSLLRQYKTGKALASDKQKRKIENGLHTLGNELLQIKL